MAITLQDVKDDLGQDYEDPALERALSATLTRAEAKIRSFAGLNQDETLDIEDEQLILDCVRYMHYHAFEDFERNYRDELVAMRNKYEARRYVPEGEESDDNE